MSCSCRNININGYHSANSLPDETCPLCALKHISYALVKYNDGDMERFVGELYLTYKHLNNDFYNEAVECFKLIENILNEIKFDKNELISLIDKIHQLAIKHKNLEVEFKNQISPNCEETLNNKLKIYLYILAINELYNFEVGYRDINIPYIIGLLQKCAELEPIDFRKNEIRNVWKLIESDGLINNDFFISFANKFLYMYKKDLKLIEIRKQHERQY